MKVIKSNNISPFGGINFVIKELDRKNIGGLLEKELPPLAKQSKYSWRDLMYSYWSVFFCGGDCAEDLSANFKTSLSQNPFVKTPSPDRVLERLKELAIPSEYFKLKRAVCNHEFVIDSKLNKLNLLILKKLFPKWNTEELTLDYDNTICYTGKKDALLTYKRQLGYQPGVGIIGEKIVYIENRNGNSTAHVLQEDTLTRMFDQLLEQQIKITNFRADSASYAWRPIQIMDKYCERFYVRAKMSQVIDQAIKSIDNWKPVGDPKDHKYRGETKYTPFKTAARRAKEKDTLKEYRLIVTKEKRRDGQVNIFTSEAFFYSSIVTNDFEKPMDNVVFFYNHRGAIEREFEVLKYDFGWNKLPFSKLSQNNVYLLITAICKNIYHYLINFFSSKTSKLEPTFRLKKFIFRFITIPAKWIRHSRQIYLKLYGEIGFET